jgi:hypothetical protein
VYFGVVEENGGIAYDGKVLGPYPFGVYMVVCCTVIHHLQILINLRDWNLMFLFPFVVSLGLMPLILYFQDKTEDAALYESIYGYVLE